MSDLSRAAISSGGPAWATRPSSTVPVVDRRREAIIWQAAGKFQEFAHETGRHRRNRVDAQHRRPRGADDLVGHAADQAFLAAEQEADDRDISECGVQSIERYESPAQVQF